MENQKLIRLITDSEDTLMDSILQYAIKHDYAQYTSTLAEAWRMSISGLSLAFIDAIKKTGEIPPVDPHITYTKNDVTAFAIHEAKMHRDRGIPSVMFIGLMKYYRQAYLDLIAKSGWSKEEKTAADENINRFFDHTELALIRIWVDRTETETLADLQATTRNVINEKNKYLTVFESISDPIILFDRDNHITDINHCAAEQFLDVRIPGMKYYSNLDTERLREWLNSDVKHFVFLGQDEMIIEKSYGTKSGRRTYQIKLKKMLDVSEKFAWTVVICHDITERLMIENELKEQYSKLEYYAYTDPMTGVRNRRTGLLLLDAELEEMKNGKGPLTVVFLDIDGLKAVNDTYGHDEGDRLIEFIVSLIKASVSESVSISRLGGDEFLLIFPNCEQNEAESVMREITQHIMKYDRRKVKPYRHQFSYGCFQVPRLGRIDANEVLRIVDKEMYLDKSRKRQLQQ